MLQGQKRSISGYLESQCLIHRHEILSLSCKVQHYKCITILRSHNTGVRTPDGLCTPDGISAENDLFYQPIACLPRPDRVKALLIK